VHHTSTGDRHVHCPAYTPRAPVRYEKREGADPLLAVVSILLGVLVVVLGFLALMMWLDSHSARDAARDACRRSECRRAAAASST
jgi:hypothetical protein